MKLVVMTWIGLILCFPQGYYTAQAINTQPISQRILFEVSYENSAWGHQLKGIYIDQRGRIYAYDSSDISWEPADPDHYTEEELLQKFQSKSELVGTIAPNTLLAMNRLIRPASQGALSEPTNKCNDAGIKTYRAYLFDREARTYTPVTLYQAGDWARKNLSESAEVLYKWLFTLKGGEPFDACAPQ